MTQNHFSKQLKNNNSMSQLLIVPSSELTAKEIEKLEQAGYVVVVSDNPERVRLISPSLDSNDFFLSALFALTGAVNGHERFVRELHRRLTEKETTLNN